jgi:hypothetical protein
MSGGQQIDSAQGTVGGCNRSVPLRSKKVGGGTAEALLSGQAVSGQTGTLVAAKGASLTGISVTFQQGTLLYRGQATLTWNPVTTNTDGSPCTDLAGYMILHGTSPNFYSEFVTLGLVTTYVWGGLLPGVTHYWVVQAFDTEVPPKFSPNSAEASKTY